MIDPRIPDDNAMAQVRRVTPEIPFPEGEKCSWAGQLTYGAAWPLSEKYYISESTTPRTNSTVCGW